MDLTVRYYSQKLMSCFIYFLQQFRQIIWLDLHMICIYRLYMLAPKLSAKLHLVVKYFCVFD